MAISFGVVIPTAGRPSIIDAVRSVQDSSDETVPVIVVYDGYGPKPENYFDFFSLEETLSQLKEIVLLRYDCAYNDWGYPQLNHAYKEYPSWSMVDYLMNIGDDDVMIEGVTKRITDAINSMPLQPLLFQAELWPSPHRGNTEPVLLWNDSDRSIERQKVTGQNLLVPAIPHMMGSMVDDFVFIKETVKMWYNHVTWIPIVTCRCY